MSKATPATQALTRAKLAFTLHSYAYDPGAERIGLQAAEALGEAPARVLKTLMTRVDGKPICVVLASDREVAMKALAAAVGGKTAEMMPPADAERLTGFKVGGISPFGQKRAAPTVIDAAALTQPYVLINGGQRGLLLRLDPASARDMLGAIVAAVSV